MDDVEAVARALCGRTELNPDAMMAAGEPMQLGLKTVIMAFSGLQPAWRLFEDDARAAVATIVSLGYKAP